MDEELIRRWSSGQHHNDKGAALALSALCFHDPNEKTGEASGMLSHLGMHPANIKCVLGNKPALRRLCRAVSSAVSRCNKDVLGMLVLCKSGRHRNVALGACLQLALKGGHEGPRPTNTGSFEPRALAAHVPVCSCSYCVQCTEFNAQWHIMEIAKVDGFRWWYERVNIMETWMAQDAVLCA